MAELPKLTREERKLIIEEAMDLNYDAAEREAMEWAEACATASFQMLDEMEAAELAQGGAFGRKPDERRRPASLRPRQGHVAGVG